MPDTITSPSEAQFRQAARNLTKAQRYHVERGCISGDFTMNTVNALKRKGLFHLVISSPNGQCGFMELTDLGKRVRAHFSPAQSSGATHV